MNPEQTVHRNPFSVESKTALTQSCQLRGTFQNIPDPHANILVPVWNTAHAEYKQKAWIKLSLDWKGTRKKKHGVRYDCVIWVRKIYVSDKYEWGGDMITWQGHQSRDQPVWLEELAEVSKPPPQKSSKVTNVKPVSPHVNKCLKPRNLLDWIVNSEPVKRECSSRRESRRDEGTPLVQFRTRDHCKIKSTKFSGFG